MYGCIYYCDFLPADRRPFRDDRTSAFRTPHFRAEESGWPELAKSKSVDQLDHDLAAGVAPKGPKFAQPRATPWGIR
jgi:hypothetical protein